MLLLPTPASLADELTVVMRRLADSQPASDNLSAVAISWLLQNGKIDPAEVPFDQYMAAGFVTLGLLALDDPESVPGVMAEGRSEAEQLRFIEEIGRRMPLHAVALLEAIDHHHADKVIRKAARKELFRVRSRLASQRL